MSLQGARVLVTGAGGFIGSHLVERLVADGATVRALLRYTSSALRGNLEESEARDEVDFALGDVRDASAVRSALEGREIVFHLAALIGIPYSYEAPDSYVRTNVEGTFNVLEAARAIGARVVATSTSEVYGTARYVPMDEGHPLSPQSPYAATKVAADMLALSYHRSFELPVVVLRPFNTFGPRQSARAVVPTIVSQLLAGPVVRLGSLSPERDLTFVTDTVDAFVRAAESDAALGTVINVGMGTSVSVAELVRRVAGIVGRDARVEEDAARVRPAASEVERLCADASVAHDLLHWKATVALDEGLRRTVDWARANPHAFRPGWYAR